MKAIDFNYGKGFTFSKHIEKDVSDFDRVFGVFKELLTHTSGDIEEAFEWLKTLDAEYNIFNENYSLEDQKNGFRNNNSLRHSNYFLKRSITKTENKLHNRGIPITNGKIISGQTFGFWIALFLGHHYSLIEGQPLHVFVHKPPTENRASIYSKLNAIRNFRNRVNHCEPICFNANGIDCSEVISIVTKLYDLICWIEPDLVPFFKSIDNTQNKIDNIYRI